MAELEGKKMLSVNPSILLDPTVRKKICPVEKYWGWGSELHTHTQTDTHPAKCMTGCELFFPGHTFCRDLDAPHQQNDLVLQRAASAPHVPSPLSAFPPIILSPTIAAEAMPPRSRGEGWPLAFGFSPPSLPSSSCLPRFGSYPPTVDRLSSNSGFCSRRYRCLQALVAACYEEGVGLAHSGVEGRKVAQSSLTSAILSAI